MKFNGLKIPIMENVKFKGKRVLVRVDYNVPVNSKGEPDSEFRIMQTIETIQYLIREGAIVLLVSHLELKKKNLSLEFLVPTLSEILNQNVIFIKDYLDGAANEAIGKMKPGQVALFENIRFHEGEKKCDEDFAEQLAGYGDYLIEDAFGVFHRKHASITALPPFFKGRCAAGKLVQKELLAIETHMNNPKTPMIAIIGGAKLDEGGKLEVINALLKKDYKVLLGGLLGFFVSRFEWDVDIGPKPEKEIRETIKKIETKPGQLFWPYDFIYQGGVNFPLSPKDIGPDTIERYIKMIGEAKTIFCNGPVGHFETDQYKKGTEKILRAIAENKYAVKIIGGGDTISAAEQGGFINKYTHVSTGGGALLNLIANGTLVGIEALAKAA